MSTLFYEGQPKHYVTVDCLVLGFEDDRLYLLVAERRFEPLKGKNSLLAGFIRNNENLNDTVSRVVMEYTGVDNIYMDQVGVYGDVNRDVADRVITIAYYALIDMQSFNKKLCEINKTRWIPLDEVNDLILDHEKILADAIRQLKKKAATEPIGLSLLPEKFTLTQLQTLYETIYQEKIDKRNFRRRFLNIGLLEKQNEKDMSGSKKGAFYYKFEKKKYEEYVKKGFF